MACNQPMAAAAKATLITAVLDGTHTHYISAKSGKICRVRPRTEY
jgi:hypothetical protein